MRKTILEEEFRTITDEEATMHKDDYPFSIRVLVTKDITPRDRRFTKVLDSGLDFVERLFGTGGKLHKTEFAVFPERYMSCIEQQSTMAVIKKKAVSSGLKELRVITGSPLLVSSFHKEYIRILSFPKDNPKSMYHKDYLKALFLEGKNVV